MQGLRSSYNLLVICYDIQRVDQVPEAAGERFGIETRLIESEAFERRDLRFSMSERACKLCHRLKIRTACTNPPCLKGVVETPQKRFICECTAN